MKTWSLMYEDTVTQPSRKADTGQHARRKRGIGRRNRKHDAPMRGDGLCPHERDDWRESRFWKSVEVAILCSVTLLADRVGVGRAPTFFDDDGGDS